MADQDPPASKAGKKDSSAGGKGGGSEEKIPPEKPRIEGEEILSLLEDINHIDKPSAMRELNVSSETFDRWVKALAKDGWIKVIDGELNDEYFIEQGRYFRERVQRLEEIQEQENAPEPVKKKVSVGKISGAMMKRVSSLIGSIIHFAANFIYQSFVSIPDIILLIAFIQSAYLIGFFLKEPNERIMNFVVSAVLFSAALFMYRNTSFDLKTRYLEKKANAVVKTTLGYWKVFILIVLLILLVYFGGLSVIYPENRVTSILVGTLVLNSIIQLYHPLKPLYRIPLSHVGMLLAVYSLLLMLGATSISETLSEEKDRIMDVFAGVVLLALVYLNRDFFGVSKAHFRRLLYTDKTQ
ncbi:MAG: hypothetical protein PHG85_04695 [Candidatus Altiarchaeota archaeon]|nr:hypothetical protein [Candidatus Altiarchaeota archaeon]